MDENSTATNMTAEQLIRRLSKYHPRTRIFVCGTSGYITDPVPDRIKIPPKNIINFDSRYYKVAKKSGCVEGVLL